MPSSPVNAAASTVERPMLASLRFSAYGGKTSVFIADPSLAGWTATVSSDAGWLSLAGPASGRGPGVVTLTAGKSVADTRATALTILIHDGTAPTVWPVIQATAAPLATLNASVLQLTFPDVPNVMEFGIAGKFIAQEIQKIPEPFDLIALAIVEIIVVALGLIAILLREALALVVPEPLTWFGTPEIYAKLFDPLTLALPATAVFITEETALLAIYIAEETLDGGE